MYYKTKYIIVDTGVCVVPILFSELAAHSDIAKAFPSGVVLGAGFAWLQDAKPGENPQYTCEGESISLDIKSRKEVDAKIVNKYMGLSF